MPIGIEVPIAVLVVVGFGVVCKYVNVQPVSVGLSSNSIVSINRVFPTGTGLHVGGCVGKPVGSGVSERDVGEGVGRRVGGRVDTVVDGQSYHDGGLTLC